jgi:hypothetical protein
VQRLAVAGRLITNRGGRIMAIDFEWNGKRWEAIKVRRKLAWHEHKGVAYYDRERMRQPLTPIVHPRDFEGWSMPLPSWIDSSWDASVEPGTPCSDTANVNEPGDPPIAQSRDYTLERCHVKTISQCQELCHGKWLTKRRPVLYRWELTFTDGATFRFVSRAIAELALSELLRIRRVKHPRHKFGKHSAENESVFFTNRKLRKLPADASPEELTAIATPVETAA